MSSILSPSEYLQSRGFALSRGYPELEHAGAVLSVRFGKDLCVVSTSGAAARWSVEIVNAPELVWQAIMDGIVAAFQR